MINKTQEKQEKYGLISSDLRSVWLTLDPALPLSSKALVLLHQMNYSVWRFAPVCTSKCVGVCVCVCASAHALTLALLYAWHGTSACMTDILEGDWSTFPHNVTMVRVCQSCCPTSRQIAIFKILWRNLHVLPKQNCVWGSGTDGQTRQSGASHTWSHVGWMSSLWF